MILVTFTLKVLKQCQCKSIKRLSIEILQPYIEFLSFTYYIQINLYLLFITSIVPQNIDQAVGTLQGNINDIFFDATVSGTIESNNDGVLMKIQIYGAVF